MKNRASYFVAIGIVAVMALTFLSAFSASASPTVQIASKGTFKIGFINAFTGLQTAMGIDVRDGFLMFLDENNNQLGGFDVDMVIEDDASDVNTAVTKAHKLVEMDNVDMLIGPSYVAAAYAIAPYAIEQETALLIPNASGDLLAQGQASKYVIRTTVSSSQSMHALGEYVCNTLGYKRIGIIAYDTAFGYEVGGGFQRSFENAGGTVVYKGFFPNATQDYAPFISQIPVEDIDALFYNCAGGDSIRLSKQLSEFGVTSSIPIIAGFNSCDETILAQLTDAEGFITAMPYSKVLDTPKNNEFVPAFAAKYDRPGSWASSQGYMAAQILNAGLADMTLEQLKDPVTLISMLADVKLDNTPSGTISFDDYNQLVTNIYIRRVENVNGQWQNTVIHTYENVSQFWLWDPAEYLSWEPYGRHNPPAPGS